MPINPNLKTMLSHLEGYYDLLEDCCKKNEFKPLEKRLEDLRGNDINLKPYANDEKGSRYYKPFHHAAFPKIIESFRRDLPQGKIPIIDLSFSEIDEARKQLQISRFQSQQDVLYGFTSERYKKWGPTLTDMGFQSACMVGEAEINITMAPRYLELNDPDETITEILGGISQDFWQTVGIVFGNPYLNTIDDLSKYLIQSDSPIKPFSGLTKLQAGDNLIAFLSRISADVPLPMIDQRKASFLLDALRSEREKIKPNFSSFYQMEQQMSQEQIGLKYADEGKYVQKILGGKRVEHLQSNVKMIKNPLRGNKCEVDSIYRVLGEKRIVLLEAKGKDSVSRAQIYQIYETFRLKTPNAWDLTVLVLLMSKSKERANTTVIDMAEMAFDETCFGNITESLCSLKAHKHYRWLIKQPD